MSTLFFHSNTLRAARACVLTAAFVWAAAAQDPPARIARLNYLSGNVSMQPAGAGDWAPAEPNRPFTTGDSLYTDLNSRAEFHLDLGIVRVGQQSTFGFLTLNDQTVQLQLTEGDLSITLRELDPNQVFEVDSPNAAISLLRPGTYRFRVTANGQMTFVVVRQGQAEISGGGQAFNLTPGNSAALTGTTQLAFDIELAPEPDDLDQWCADRDTQEARLASARYLPRSVVGYEDMDEYGGWQSVDGYGVVWYPRTVAVGWAPYHNGHWAWIEPWGWTWVDDAPWGFAPFHYGRWAFISGRWGWCPGPIVVIANRPPVVRPVYAPALVAWFGGANWGVSIHVGGGAPSLGWVPLGFGEVYTPAYHCSPHYFNNVNVANTTIVKTVNITNVYNNVYINKTVYNQHLVNVQAPNAVSAMQQSSFAQGRHVGQAGFTVPVTQARMMQPGQGAVIAPPVAPARQALLGSQQAAARPSTQILARQVVVRTTPAVKPSPFAERQVYLQQHVGQPHDFVSMHNQLAPQNPQPEVRHLAQQPQPKVVQPGEHFGNAPAQSPKPPQSAFKPAEQTKSPAAVNTERPVEAARPVKAEHPVNPERPVPAAAPRVVQSAPVHSGYPGREPERVSPPAKPAEKPAPKQEQKENKADRKGEHKEPQKQ